MTVQPEQLLMFVPLLVGIILTQALKATMKTYFGVYFLLVAANVALTYTVLDGGVLAPLVTGVIGALVMLVGIGIFGTRVRHADFGFAGFGVGLFPWVAVGLVPSISYIIILGGFVVLVALRPKLKNPFRRSYKR